MNHTNTINTDSLTKVIAESSWRNSYWFARMLLSGDKYGGIGKSKEKQLLELCSQLEIILERGVLTASEKVTVCKDMISKTLTNLFAIKAKGYALAELLAADINEDIISLDDVGVFIVAVKYMVAPMNAAIALAPSSDAEFCRTTAKNILDSLGESSVGKVVGTWDNLGVKGCLDAERSLVLSEFTKLRSNLAALTF